LVSVQNSETLAGKINNTSCGVIATKVRKKKKRKSILLQVRQAFSFNRFSIKLIVTPAFRLTGEEENSMNSKAVKKL